MPVNMKHPQNVQKPLQTNCNISIIGTSLEKPKPVAECDKVISRRDTFAGSEAVAVPQRIREVSHAAMDI